MPNAFIISLEDSLKNDPSRDFPQSTGIKDEGILQQKRESSEREKQARILINKLSRKKCKAGLKNFRDFESLVKEIFEITLKKSFVNHVVTYHSRTLKLKGFQQKIRDISFPINPKDLNPSCIWNRLKEDYSLKSLILECKNYYRSKITSEEIYQLFEYLDPKEHGKLALIVSRNGEKDLDESARSAIVRIVKDHYKFIIIGDKDLLCLIKSYALNGSPEIFFNGLIDSKRGWPI